MILLFTAGTALITSAVFFGLIGAYALCALLLLALLLLILFLPIGKHKNKNTEPIVWTVYDNRKKK